MSFWTVPIHDIRKIYIDQHIYAQIEADWLRAEMERGGGTDIWRFERCGGDSLYFDSGFIQFPALKIQIDKCVQHGGMCIFDDDDKCSNLQLGDNQIGSDS